MSTKLLRRFVRKFDQFGYKFAYNFEGNEDIYTTTVGGVASIGMGSVILFLFFQQIAIMNSLQQFSIFESSDITDFNKLGTKKITELDMLIYFQFQRQDGFPLDKNLLLNGFMTYNEQNHGLNTNTHQVCKRSQFEAFGMGQNFDKFDQNQTLLLCLNAQDVLNGPIPLNLADPKPQNSAVQVQFLSCNNQPDCASETEFNDMARQLLVIMHVIQEKFDANIKTGKPTKFEDINYEIFKFTFLQQRATYLYVKQNTIQRQGILNFLSKKQQWSYFDIDTDLSIHTNLPLILSDPQVSFYYLCFGLSSTHITHQQIYFGIFDVLGWVGGNQVYVQILFNIVIGSFGYHIFIIEIIEGLFHGKKGQVYNQKDRNAKKKKIKKQNEKYEKQKIKFTFWQILTLYVITNLNGLLCQRKLSKQISKENYFQVYRKGLNKSSDETDVLNVMKNLRYIKSFCEINGLDQKMIKNIQSLSLNCIDLSESSCEEGENSDKSFSEEMDDYGEQNDEQEGGSEKNNALKKNKNIQYNQENEMQIIVSDSFFNQQMNDIRKNENYFEQTIRNPVKEIVVHKESETINLEKDENLDKQENLDFRRKRLRNLDESNESQIQFISVNDIQVRSRRSIIKNHFKEFEKSRKEMSAQVLDSQNKLSDR